MRSSMTSSHAHLAEQLHRRRHVVQVRHVADRDRLVGEQARGEDRQHGVLRAGDPDVAVQRFAAVDDDFGHWKLGSGLGSGVRARDPSVPSIARRAFDDDCDSDVRSRAIRLVIPRRSRRFFGRQRAQRQRMDRAAHELAERRIDHAVPRQRQLARERGTDHERLEMHAIGPADLDFRVGQALSGSDAVPCSCPFAA